MDKPKYISELSGEELARIGQEAVRKVRERLFARGRSVVWDRKGIVVREHPDGRMEILMYLSPSQKVL